MLLFFALQGCHHVQSEEQAEAAYAGLDAAVDRALNLGMDGFNAASSANIDDQEAEGDTSGTMVVSGQVDQGSSDNKGLRLEVALTDYSDTLGDDGEPDIVYTTDAPASLEIQLRDIPADESSTGTLEGTLDGTFEMDGVLIGEVALSLAISANIAVDADGVLSRVEDSTTVTGTAESPYGTYEVDVTR